MWNSATPPEAGADRDLRPVALILAGGRGQRLGGADKGLLDLDGTALIQRVIDAARPHVSDILISANRHPAQYQQYGYRVVGDLEAGFAGPLEGIASGMAQCDDATPLLTLPCDTPLVSATLVQRLISHYENTSGIDVVVAHDGQRLQPLYALYRPALATSLREFLATDRRRAQDWIATLDNHIVNCADHPEWFSNVNTPEDLAQLAQHPQTPARHD